MKSRLHICFMLVTLITLNSCHLFGTKPHLYHTAAAANDKMMFLNDDVDALGSRRIDAITKTYPNVAEFLEDKGRPTYFAESMNKDDHMIVFYYPENKEAYACRYAIGSTTEMEFSGPFPIAPDEMKQLRRLAESESESFSIRRDGTVASKTKF